MGTALEFVLQSRRQTVRMISIIMSVSAGVGLLLVGAMMLITGNYVGLMPYVGTIVLGVVGGVLTLMLIAKRPLRYAMLPLVIGVAGAVFLSAVLVPEQTLIAVPLLTIPVLLMSLGQDRMFTIGVGLFATIAGGTVAAMAPRPMVAPERMIIGDALPLVNAFGVIILIVLVVVVVSRFIAISDTAVDMADQRTAEAESAREAAESARLIIEQRSAEQERLLELVSTLETPVITISDGVLLAPIVGHLDSRRTDRLSQRLLEAVHNQRVTTVIMDIGGVPLVDTQVAQALVRTAQAVQLLGSSVILSGITSSIALTLSSLGIRLDEFQAVRSPQEALTLLETNPRNGMNGRTKVR